MSFFGVSCEHTHLHLIITTYHLYLNRIQPTKQPTNPPVTISTTARQVLEHAATRGPRWSQPQEGESTRRTRARLEEAWIETQAAAGEFGANFLPAPGMNTNGNNNGTTGDGGANGIGNGISGRMLAGNRLLQFGTPTDVFGNPVGFNNQDRDDPRGLGTMDPNNPMVRHGNAT